jgi:hypothetical protein
MDPASRAERIRKEAAKFYDLAESASSAFLRGYYLRLADRYLSFEGEWRPLGRQGFPSKRRTAYAAGHIQAP